MTCAQSISTYVSNLEKDNAALRKRVKDLEESRDYLLQHIQDENTKLWDEYSAEDDESVASNTDESESESESSTMAQITGDEPYESDSDATTVGKPGSSETEETESESESDSDYFVCYNHDLTAFLDDLADREENKYKKYAFRHAANMVYNYPSKVKCGEQIAHISGIGQGIIRRIDEYLETETLTTDSESEYESDLLSPLKGKN